MHQILILLGIAILGVSRLLSRLYHIGKNHEFTQEYIKTFQQYVTSQGQDNKSYTWLVQRSDVMQEELGYRGIYSQYRPPASNYVIPNYAIILNMLPELRRSFNSSQLASGSLSSEYAALLQEALLRHVGNLEERHRVARKHLLNPFIWFQEGVKGILLFPLNIIAWMGLVNPKSTLRISTNSLFQVISGFIGLVTLVSSLISIIVGWEAFTSFVRRLF